MHKEFWLSFVAHNERVFASTYLLTTRYIRGVTLYRLTGRGLNFNSPCNLSLACLHSIISLRPKKVQDYTSNNKKKNETKKIFVSMIFLFNYARRVLWALGELLRWMRDSRVISSTLEEHKTRWACRLSAINTKNIFFYVFMFSVKNYVFWMGFWIY